MVEFNIVCSSEDKLSPHICTAQRINSFHIEAAVKYFSLKLNATLTSAITAGTSTSGPITEAKASPELIQKTAMAHKALQPCIKLVMPPICYMFANKEMYKKRDGALWYIGTSIFRFS